MVIRFTSEKQLTVVKVVVSSEGTCNTVGVKKCLYHFRQKNVDT